MTLVAFKIAGPATNQVSCGVDSLYAYWLFRHYRLDQHPLVQKHHGRVLARPSTHRAVND